jgi:hypothetical protein
VLQPEATTADAARARRMEVVRRETIIERAEQ